jgi:hypothetical protein
LSFSAPRVVMGMVVIFFGSNKCETAASHLAAACSSNFEFNANTQV